MARMLAAGNRPRPAWPGLLDQDHDGDSWFVSKEGVNGPNRKLQHHEHVNACLKSSKADGVGFVPQPRGKGASSWVSWGQGANSTESASILNRKRQSWTKKKMLAADWPRTPASILNRRSRCWQLIGRRWHQRSSPRECINTRGASKRSAVHLAVQDG